MIDANFRRSDTTHEAAHASDSSIFIDGSVDNAFADLVRWIGFDGSAGQPG